MSSCRQQVTHFALESAAVSSAVSSNAIEIHRAISALPLLLIEEKLHAYPLQQGQANPECTFDPDYPFTFWFKVAHK